MSSSGKLSIIKVLVTWKHVDVEIDFKSWGLFNILQLLEVGGGGVRFMMKKLC